MRFLPGHDQWVIGPGTKDVHVTPSARREPMTRKANPVIVGGVVCGTWARRVTSSRSPGSTRDSDLRAAIEEEAARLAAILGDDLRLTLEN